MVAAEWMCGGASPPDRRPAESTTPLRDRIQTGSLLGQLEVNVFGYDYRVRSLAVFARVLWLRGFPEQAERTARQESKRQSAAGIRTLMRYLVLYGIGCVMGMRTTSLPMGVRSALSLMRRDIRLLPTMLSGLGSGELAVCRGGAASGVAMLRDALAALHQEQHHMVHDGVFNVR